MIWDRPKIADIHKPWLQAACHGPSEELPDVGESRHILPQIKKYKNCKSPSVPPHKPLKSNVNSVRIPIPLPLIQLEIYHGTTRTELHVSDQLIVTHRQV